MTGTMATEVDVHPSASAVDGVRRLYEIVPNLRGMNARVFQRGDLELYPGCFRARWKGTEVHLTIRQYMLVEHLASQHEDVSWREIYDVVRGIGFVAGDGEDGLRAIVRSWIKRIRQNFHAVDPDFDAIEVHAGFGYRWREPLPSNVTGPAFTA